MGINVPLLILAGGRATRLLGLSENCPKYLMPIQDGMCFADFHLRWAKNSGFSMVILSLGYLGEKIVDYCGDGSKWNLKIIYLFDGSTPLGTGGAVRLTLQFPYEAIAVTYGDTILSFDVDKCWNHFVGQNKHALMSVYRNQIPGHICNANLVNGLVQYDKLNPNPSWSYIDYGFLILRRQAVLNFSLENPLDLSKPLSELSKEGELIGFEAGARFWEIGSPEALQEFKDKFANSVN